MTDDGEPDRPGPVARLVGVGAVVGAILWPVGLSGIAADAIASPAGSAVSQTATTILPLAIALLLFTLTVATLEQRAPLDIGLVDLIGDLTIGTAAVLVLLAAVLKASELLGPGFALLIGGSIIFGAAGLNGKRRPRWGSALVASGAGGLLACFVVVSALGIERLAELAQTVLISLLIYAAGWAWLGLHLALGRGTGAAPGQRSPPRESVDRD